MIEETKNIDELADAYYQRVLEESKRFRAKLPELLERYNGRWVIFLHGEVQADFEDGDEGNEAYEAAILAYGLHGGFVIALVRPGAGDPVIA